MIESFRCWLRWRRHGLSMLLEALMEDVILWTDSDPFTD